MASTIERQKEYQILTHAGHYIDVTMLGSGLYPGVTPQLYHPETTIGELIDNALKFEQGGIKIGDYVKNISKCKLERVRLEF